MASLASSFSVEDERTDDGLDASINHDEETASSFLDVSASSSSQASDEDGDTLDGTLDDDGDDGSHSLLDHEVVEVSMSDLTNNDSSFLSGGSETHQVPSQQQQHSSTSSAIRESAAAAAAAASSAAAAVAAAATTTFTGKSGISTVESGSSIGHSDSKLTFFEEEDEEEDVEDDETFASFRPSAKGSSQSFASSQSPLRRSSTASNTRETSVGSTSSTTRNGSGSTRQRQSTSTTDTDPMRPALDPYVAKLERFELFQTNQSYYLVACDKHNLAYRILKMDRTMIERPPEEVMTPSAFGGRGVEFSFHGGNAGTDNASRVKDDGNASTVSNNTSSNDQANISSQKNMMETIAAQIESSHTAKPTFRPLSDFLSEDPNVYTQAEIQDMLDMIHHGNRYVRASEHDEGSMSSYAQAQHSGGGGNAGDGGLKPMAKGYGIVGFIRFLDCYYLTLITRRAKVGSIGGNGIYTIKNTETFPLKPAERLRMGRDGRLGGGLHGRGSGGGGWVLDWWNQGKRSLGVGLTNREIAELRYQGLYNIIMEDSKNFFFSYSYDLTRSLQENCLAMTAQPFPPPSFKDMYAWNFFLTRELEGCTTTMTSYHWVMPIVHGAFVQRKLHDYGRMLNLLLIARRSRHFAGTRYLKRGVSEQGKVANDVEHEQILHDEGGLTLGGTFSSFLQVRGSIPTFWTQESSVTMPKPPIELSRVDPTYRATQAHFKDLLERYGSPIIVLDLVKQSEKRERETLVGNEYRHAVDYINTSIEDPRHKLRYCALDYSHISKHRNLDVSTSLNHVSTWAVNQTGFFCSAPQWKIVQGGSIVPFGNEDKKPAKFLSEELGLPIFPMEQRGVLRVNCIDCLDRTNVANFSAGVESLEQQLVVMGIRSSANLEPSAAIIKVLIDMYVEIGDHIALQYGGSEAHKKVSSARSESNTVLPGPISKQKELLTSVRRYYSNAFTDRLKQDSINLLLGYYIPFRHTIPLWEMETDFYLHNLHVKFGRGTYPSMRTYQRMFGVQWNEIIGNDEERHEPDGPNPTARMRSEESDRRDAFSTMRSSSSGENSWRESARIARVRERCRMQSEALSIWWKDALQRNIQSRMWMQLSQHPEEESIMPPRFDRLYQPEKIAQFDRFFARAWATPVRRSHAAQQVSSSASGGGSELSEYRKSISGRPNEMGKNENGDESGDEDGDICIDLKQTLKDYVEKRGYRPNKALSLKLLIEPHQGVRGSKQMLKADELSSLDYVGKLPGADEREKPCEEFVSYAAPMSRISSSPYKKEAYEEFKACLHDTSLLSDDVEGLAKLDASANIGRTVRSTEYIEYHGLHQSKSATEVSTVLYEQLLAMDGMKHRGGEGAQLRNMMSTVDEELVRRGYDTPGMKEAVMKGWKDHERAQQQYSELLSPVSVESRRSDLTTAESMKLYMSFFEDDTELSKMDLSFINGEESSIRKKEKGSTHKEPIEDGFTWTGMDRHSNRDYGSFVERAARKGYKIPSMAEISRAKPPPLFSWTESHVAPAGFEQINDDLFSMKDNKFIVFNYAGVATWSKSNEPEPVTKLLSHLPKELPTTTANISAYIQQIM